MSSHLPTITDVARRAGVSTASVSRVLNSSDRVSEGLRAAVQNAILDVGYVPNAAARSLRIASAAIPLAASQGAASPDPKSGSAKGWSGKFDRTRKEEGTMKGPAIFLAQFMSDKAPFNTLPSIAGWAAGHGYKGVQLPTVDAAYMDLKKAAESKDYCQELQGICAEQGVEITELSTHLQGQLVAVHPAYDQQFDAFAPAEVHGNPKARTEWAIDQMKLAAKASANMGFGACVSFSGSLAFPYLYPWPQRPDGMLDEAFGELAKRWGPIFDAYDDAGVDVAFELHPGEDLFDGATFEMLLDRVGGHSRCCINYDPSHFPAAAAGLPRVHRYLPRADQGVSRQGRRVQSDGQAGGLQRLSEAGPNAPGASGRWAMARWISSAFSPSWHSTATTAGRCWSGNAA